MRPMRRNNLCNTEGEPMTVEQTVLMFKSMMQGSFSRIELAQRIDANPKSVGKFISEMKEQKMIHVVDYTNETDGRNRVKVYVMGDGVDAEPKRTQSQEARSRKSYMRKLAAKRRANIKTTFVGGKGLWQ
jgi:transcription initiation factor IIE alpha subunit